MSEGLLSLVQISTKDSSVATYIAKQGVQSISNERIHFFVR